jgi:hypothetical protein
VEIVFRFEINYLEKRDLVKKAETFTLTAEMICESIKQVQKKLARRRLPVTQAAININRVCMCPVENRLVEQHYLLEHSVLQLVSDRNRRPLNVFFRDPKKVTDNLPTDTYVCIYIFAYGGFQMFPSSLVHGADTSFRHWPPGSQFSIEF